MDLTKILIPTDFSPHSDKAVSWGASLAEKYGAQGLLLHVIPETVEEVSRYRSAWEQTVVSIEAKVEAQLFEAALTELKDGVNLDVRITMGDPAEEIVRVAREEAVDLIVMGAHGHPGSHYLLIGSTAETVFDRAPCPVFLVRSREGIAH